MVNGKPLAWIFSSQIPETEAPSAVLAGIYSSQAGELLGFLALCCLLLFVYFGLDLFMTRLP
jgi:hypothetical protein